MGTEWFYYASILVSFLFTMYISIYSAIHFEDIRFMNLALIFFFFAIAMFFIISFVYFQTERLGHHKYIAILFFAGALYLIFYAYNAVDASNIVKYSIIYTIIIIGASLAILMSKTRLKPDDTSLQAKKSQKGRL